MLLLPTAMGLTPHEQAMAVRLAREGFTTLALGYTKRTTGAVVKNEQLRKHHEQVVMRGCHMLLADPMTDKSRAAVIGFSLGGYFAAYLATGDEAPLQAAVIYYGVYPTLTGTVSARRCSYSRAKMTATSLSVTQERSVRGTRIYARLFFTLTLDINLISLNPTAKRPAMRGSGQFVF